MRICHSCAVVAVNDDDSHLEPAQAKACRKGINKLERRNGGVLVPDTFDERAGSAMCDVCGYRTYDATYGIEFN